MNKSIHTPVHRRIPLAISGLLCLGMVAVNGHGEELRTSVATHMEQQARSTTAMPKAGLSQSDVESRFGQPESTKGPVGDPSITIWEYPTFSVYFENQTVIHTVLKSG